MANLIFDTLSKEVFKRESLTLMNNNTNKMETWDHLTVYDSDGEVVKRSGRHHPESDIHMYVGEGVILFAPPYAKQGGEVAIYIDITTLKNINGKTST